MRLCSVRGSSVTLGLQTQRTLWAPSFEEGGEVGPGVAEGLGVAVPGDPVAVHLGEGAEVDGAGGVLDALGPAAEVVVVVAGGDVVEVLAAWVAS
jgi:hypothetical protein